MSAASGSLTPVKHLQLGEAIVGATQPPATPIGESNY